MKMLFMLLILVSCSSYHKKNASQKKAPEYDSNVNCSPEALNYISQKMAGSKTNAKPVPSNPVLIREQMLLIQPGIANCFVVESKSHSDLPELNMCAVIGTDKDGKIEYSNFHVSEAELSKDFYQCVNATLKDMDMSPFKHMTLTQPFKLTLPN